MAHTGLKGPKVGLCLFVAQIRKKEDRHSNKKKRAYGVIKGWNSLKNTYYTVITDTIWRVAVSKGLVSAL